MINLSTPSISIIIPTKDRELILKDHLNMLLNATHKIKVEIIIVNDSDKKLIKIQENQEIKIYKNTKKGVASARNLGAKKALAPILLFLDDDMIVFESNIDAILHFHAKQNNCFLNLNWEYPPEINEQLKQNSFGRYLQYYRFNSLKGWNKDNENWNDDHLFETNGITSQNLSVTKDTFLKIGGYNENFPYAGFEDYEFSKRINKEGYKIFINPNQMTYHNETDRLELNNWLARKYRGGITRRIAVYYGFNDYFLQVGLIKKTVIFLILPLIKPISAIASFVCKSEKSDYVFFKLVNQLLALSIYGGYFSKEARDLVRSLQN